MPQEGQRNVPVKEDNEIMGPTLFYSPITCVQSSWHVHVNRIKGLKDFSTVSLFTIQLILPPCCGRQVNL